MQGYKDIVAHYEQCFAAHGDNHKGVDWPNLDDLVKRYNVMLGLIRGNEGKVSLLDFGCGNAMMKTHLESLKLSETVSYAGLDIGQSFIDHNKQKFPGTDFYNIDVLQDSASLPEFDYIVMNGVFTEKRSMSYEEMFDYMEKLLDVVFSKARKGIAFNVMSKHVDWEREDLFHVPIDPLTGFLTKKISRHFVVRNDYGLYEYTVYVYRQPSDKINAL